MAALAADAFAAFRVIDAAHSAGALPAGDVTADALEVELLAAVDERLPRVVVHGLLPEVDRVAEEVAANATDTGDAAGDVA